MAFFIYATTTFKKEYSKLPGNVRQIAQEKVNIFIENPFATRLESHKLHGKLKDLWSFSINYEYRVVFVIEGKKIILKSIGNHSIYDRFR